MCKFDSELFRLEKLATFICIALTCLSAAGQTPLDSLKEELATFPQLDTTRVSLLLDVANALVWNDPDEAMDYTREAHTLAASLGWQKGIAHALRQEGVVHYERSDLLRALDRFQQALTTAVPFDDKPFNASIYNNIANIYADLGQLDKALEHYRHFRAVSEALHDTSNRVIATVNMASVYIEQQNVPRGIAYLTEALSLAEATANQRFKMAIHNNLGRAFAKLGNDTTALRHFKACLALAEELGSTGIKANVLNSMGELLMNQHDYAEAERHSK